MASKKEKEGMSAFICSRLEDSELYQILKQDSSHLLVKEKIAYDPNEDPRKVYLMLHNKKNTVEQVVKTVLQNRDNKIHTGHIFYKDGKNFMVRLGKRGIIKDYRSLKNYSKEEIDKMIHIRDLEDLVLKWGFSVEHPNEEFRQALAYYQTKTERLVEAVRIYSMGDVRLDYSHIKRGDPGYGHAKNRYSRDYRITEEVDRIVSNEPANFSFDDNRFFAKIQAKNKQLQLPIMRENDLK